jgi:hypothetical protein
MGCNSPILFPMTIEEAARLAHKEYLDQVGYRWVINCNRHWVVIGKTKQDTARQYLNWLEANS